MQKREVTKKQLAVIILLSIGMLAAAVLLNKFFPSGSKQTKETLKQTAVTKKATASPALTPSEKPTPTQTPDPTQKVATFFQGPKAYEKQMVWSGKWGKEFYDGGSFGGFGCGLCCMANIYTTFSSHESSPTDMYQYAKKVSGYGGGGAIDWGFMKKTLKSLGFASDVFRKPGTYEKFQKLVKESMACIVVVSSNDNDEYWEETPGHYVTLFLYDEKSDKIFLGDSGDLTHNRQWVPLKTVYRALKKSNPWQILQVSSFDSSKDKWKHKGFGGGAILPKNWK